ncbi:peptidylprolyl isomerase [Patulibacter minatonensis]|uniref:peptidylprolyl isomerase n=1 Tax=Patulibacter minatonensis TaxID=298163 RepID=UPI000687ECD3|nr:peptidylprolyl isomerase [Patulibacter minatonensis]
MAFSSSRSRSTTTRRLTALLATGALATGLAACGDDDSGSSTASTAADAPTTATSPSTTTPATTTAEEASCTSVSEPEPRTDEPDLPKPKPAKLTGSWTVTMTTNCGSFSIALDTKRQPKTAASFKSLVVAKFFDGLTFHRISPNFVIQGGDPSGDGTGGPGYSVRETPPADAAYTRGVVAMAKTGTEPDGTSGSQFYVVTAEDSGLPPQYAIVGKVVKGMDTVDRIAAEGTGQDGPPSQPVVISKAVASGG